mmetsp:Transcript_44554/g.107952  ORF Transcript_44554/g.107952 Transcript_44554/m.107952 type:complete len:202 (+) Transcript_44554:543-1148(+)
MHKWYYRDLRRSSYSKTTSCSRSTSTRTATRDSCECTTVVVVAAINIVQSKLEQHRTGRSVGSHPTIGTTAATNTTAAATNTATASTDTAATVPSAAATTTAATDAADGSGCESEWSAATAPTGAAATATGSTTTTTSAAAAGSGGSSSSSGSIRSKCLQYLAAECSFGCSATASSERWSTSSFATAPKPRKHCCWRTVQP